MQQVGQRIGWSKSKVSRVERGRSPRVTLEDLVLLGAVVGLRPSVRLFPSGRPITDQGQLELLSALNRRMHPRWSHRQEVPMPTARDLRAADQVSTIPGCAVMIEAIRRFTDAQLLVRAARLKQRDVGAERLLLLVEDTLTNRRAIRAAGEELRRSFPVSSRKILEHIAAGVDPDGDGIVLLRRARSGGRVARGDTKGERGAARSVSIAPGATHAERDTLPSR
jgi:transcriptional regulator with XRE-family HTH domain